MPLIDARVPILLCWGDADTITPKDIVYGEYFTRELVAARPRTRLAVVRAGHCPHDDAPGDVNAAIALWLAEEVEQQRP